MVSRHVTISTSRLFGCTLHSFIPTCDVDEGIKGKDRKKQTYPILNAVYNIFLFGFFYACKSWSYSGESGVKRLQHTEVQQTRSDWFEDLYGVLSCLTLWVCGAESNEIYIYNVFLLLPAINKSIWSIGCMGHQIGQPGSPLLFSVGTWLKVTP